MKQTKLSNQKRFKSYTYFGAHLKDHFIDFRVWAPNAQTVSLVGDFNQWDVNANVMNPLPGGIWETRIEKLESGHLYKYAITQTDGKIAYKADPYAFHSEVAPKTASSFWSNEDYQWNDHAWLKKRLGKNILQSPMNIYEIHPGSWNRHEDGHYLTYRELAEELIPYLLEMNYTHIEIVGILEHPDDHCQVTGYYAPTSRYGSPEDFMFFIDSCHRHGLAIILDWTLGHFCQDTHGLCLFDGSHQYESSQHQQERRMVFDYSKPEVRDFLISSAYFWFDVFHIDGLCVDEVANMTALKNDGLEKDSLPNISGATENPDALAFLRELNSIILDDFPFAILVAKDSGASLVVTQAVDKGGLGFNFKWNQEWTHDTLSYMSTDPYFRHQFHHLLTNSMASGLNENFIQPLSHEEVTPGKKSILSKLFGDYDMKFDQFRLLYGYLMTHPGKKLSFMGNEFAPFVEWKIDDSLEWFMLEFQKHRESHHYIKELNKFYLREKALWTNDHDLTGFEWLEADNQKESLLIFSRMSNDPDDHLIIVINFLPLDYHNYPIDVPLAGTYRLAFNSDLAEYGGDGMIIKKTMKTQAVSLHGHDQSIRITIPPSSIIILKRIKRRKRN